MTKLYVKTTAFTILCLATVMAIIFFALSIFSPSTIANVAFNLGNKSLSIKYSEKLNAFFSNFIDRITGKNKNEIEK